MKITYYLLCGFFLASCAPSKFYQLVELESNDINTAKDVPVSGNEHLDIKFNFWSEGGSSDLIIFNKTGKNIYIKHDECQLITNGAVIDYYDNSEYTNTKSTGKKSSFSASRSLGGAAVYGANSYYTPYSSSGSIYSAVLSNAVSVSKVNLRSSSVKRTHKKIFVIAPNSSRVMEGYSLQDFRLWDCDVSAQPTNKKSNRENGVSFDETNTPLKFRFRVCYSFDEDFIDKEFYEASAYVSQFSNWSLNTFYVNKRYKECPSDKIKKSEKVSELRSPMRYYKEYTKARR